MEKMSFYQVSTETQKEQAGALIREYLGWLNTRVTNDYGLAFDIEAMLASDLTDTTKFQPPHGRFYLAHYGEQIVGVGCLKQLSDGVGELQRMYVLPRFRGKGLGRAILERLVADARSMGYHQLKLESLEFLEAAHALYRSAGFRQIDPYADNSMESYQAAETLDRYYAITVFMEMDL